MDNFIVKCNFIAFLLLLQKLPDDPETDENKHSMSFVAAQASR
jgi:hypothetical protein